MRDDSGLHLKSISAQLEREREANVGDVSNCDKPEGKTNDLGMGCGGRLVLSSKGQNRDLDQERQSLSKCQAVPMRLCNLNIDQKWARMMARQESGGPGT